MRVKCQTHLQKRFFKRNFPHKNRGRIDNAINIRKTRSKFCCHRVMKPPNLANQDELHVRTNLHEISFLSND